MQDKIVIRGAKENNLKNINLELPRGKMIVFTGLSGSGKSSLAFDTLYAEGRRRYVESLSSYARMFLGRIEKPDVETIEGLSPAISIDQKTTSHNPRSTVGTVTEIYDYLRLLWAHIGIPHCPVCGREIKQQTIDQIVDQVMKHPDGTRLQVLAPVVRARKGEYGKLLADARKSGYVRVRIDGCIYDLSDEISLEKNKKHDIEIVIDRIVLARGSVRRLTDSIETALSLSKGLVLINLVPDGGDILFSQNYACPDCGVSIEEVAPRVFSFNGPYGACPACGGLGTQLRADPSLIIRNPELSILEGAVQVPGWGLVGEDSVAMMYYTALSGKYNFSLSTPFKDLPKQAVDALLYGTGDETLELVYDSYRGNGVLNQAFEGLVNGVERRYTETRSPAMRERYSELMSEYICPECGGRRLKKESLAVTVGGLNISQFCDLPVSAAADFIRNLELTETERLISDRIIKEINSRLGFLESVGLSYLTLSRGAATLSGGESQRIRLATQIGSSLTGVLYILDEPSIGLHQRDGARLIATLKRLRDAGNTLIVVEHDEEMIRAADMIVDIGPGAGRHGGEVVAQGSVGDIIREPRSITGKYLSGVRSVPVPARRRKPKEGCLFIRGARENNLRNIDVRIPLGVFTCVTGVSGSGKSSLINEVLYKTLAAKKNRARVRPGDCDGVDGLEYVDKVIYIDQSPIGRSPRSNPATYTSAFDKIRALFASTADAKMRGYDQGRFSFNVKGGRCEACAGDGLIKIEMHFLPDVYVPCEVCGGARYNRETLEVRYKNKNIAEVLDMTVEDALEFFRNIPSIRPKIQALYDVGLGYIKLGQPSTTLSGGEAQRVKLATELSRTGTGSSVYILDEPTTGLHADDVRRLLEILNRLTDAGNTVIVIEHNLDVIKTADHIIDLGPEGGDGGGRVIFSGTPEECAKCAESATGEYLAGVLGR